MSIIILLIYSSFIILFTQQTEAIRGALFRTGRSTDDNNNNELISSQLITPYNTQFINNNNNGINNNCPTDLEEEEEEEQLLNMASHPSLMVDLRKLLKFSRERALNEEIGNNQLSELPFPSHSTKLIKELQQNNNNNKYKSKRITNNIRRDYNNIPSKSPKLAAYIALFRNAHKNHPWAH